MVDYLDWTTICTSTPNLLVTFCKQTQKPLKLFLILKNPVAQAKQRFGS